MSKDPNNSLSGMDKHIEKFCKTMLKDPESMLGLRKILGFDHSCMADTPEKTNYLVGRRDAFRLAMQALVTYDQNRALELHEQNLTKDDNPLLGIESVLGDDISSLLNLNSPFKSY